MAWIKIGTKTTDSSGKVTFGNLPMGSYKYVQSAAITGYTADTTEYPVTISSTTPVTESRTNTPTEVGSFQVTKYRDGYPDVKLTGATFHLMNEAGATLLSESAPTDASGLITFANLMTITGTPQGYKVVEVTPPAGYDQNTSEYAADVYVGLTATQDVPDTLTSPGEIEVTLTDTNYDEFGLANSTYDLYEDIV